MQLCSWILLEETSNKRNYTRENKSYRLPNHDLIAYSGFIIHSVPNDNGEGAACVKIQTRQRTFCEPKLDKQHGIC